MKFEITNRYTGSVIYTAEIDASDDTPHGVKMGLAVRAALEAGADLRAADLRNADLMAANLSYADLRSADLRGADLINADMSCADLMGANLIDADLRSAALRGANLIYADLRGADLINADMSCADLMGANLSYAYLIDADLSGVRLTGATLPDADRIPKISDIHGKVYEAASSEGALDMRSWHDWCGTTHCRAGWVCVLAGEAGRAFERKYGTSAAAALIYQASDPSLERIPNFYATNEEAMADMKRLADMEAAQ